MNKLILSFLILSSCHYPKEPKTNIPCCYYTVSMSRCDGYATCWGNGPEVCACVTPATPPPICEGQWGCWYTVTGKETCGCIPEEILVWSK